MNARTLPHFDMQAPAAHYAQVQGLCPGVGEDEHRALAGTDRPGLLAALDRAVSSRFKPVEQEDITEAQIERATADLARTITHMDVMEQIDCDAFDSACKTNDPTLIGAVVVKAKQVYARRLALRGFDFREESMPDVEVECMALVSDWFAARGVVL